MTYVLTGPTVAVVYEGREPGNAVGLLVGDGIDRAQELARFETIEVVPPLSDVEDRLRQVIEEGAEIVIGVGFFEGGLVNEVLSDYPDVNAVLVDNFAYGPNVTSYSFAVEEGAYLAGMAAALTTQTGKVGYVGGMQFDSVEHFRAGFTQGVRSVSSEIEIEEVYVSGGDITEAFSRPDLGQRAAAELYAAGADVVFHAAGGTGVGIHEAAKEATQRTGRKHWGIGVDDDELFAVDASVRDYVLTSALKKYDAAVTMAILDAVRGEVPESGRVLSLADGATTYSQTGDHLAPSVVEKLNAAADEIAAGTVDVDQWPDGPPDRMLGSHDVVETSATIAADGSCSFTGPLEPPAGSLLRVQLSNNSSEVGGLVGWSVAFDNPGTGVMALPGLTNTLYLKLDAVAAPFEILCGVESQSGWPAVATLAVRFDGDPADAALLEDYLRAGFAGSAEVARPLAIRDMPFEGSGFTCLAGECPPMDGFFTFSHKLDSAIEEVDCNPTPSGAQCTLFGDDIIGRHVGDYFSTTFTATIENGMITSISLRPNFSPFDSFIPYLEAEHAAEFALACLPLFHTEDCAGFMISVLDGWNG
jgi:basic membrane protein A